MKQTPAAPVWRKAAVVGSLWASAEIVLGSFLHNIGVPVTGTILASIGVCLLVASHQVWPEEGLFWRAGLICAVMKSISPSSVILGAMIGILIESLLVEGAVRLFGRNTAAYVAGGAAAVSFTLIQTIVLLIFTYGTNIVELYSRFYQIAASGFGIHTIRAGEFILLLFAADIVIGVLAAASGIAIGRRAARAPDRRAGSETLARGSASLPSVNPATRFSIAWLAFHALVIIGGMLSFSLLPLWGAASILSAYFAVCIARYPLSLHRLAKPGLWIEFAVVALLASFLLGNLQSREPGWSWSGLAVGTEMNLRAALIVVGFSVVSVEVRNPKIIGWFIRRGMSEFSAALNIAFEALPAMTAALVQGRRFISHPFAAIPDAIRSANDWLRAYEKEA